MSIAEVVLQDGRYPLEAYAFLHEGLKLAGKNAHGEQSSSGNRHVTGAQICQACLELALERWGMLARTVLSQWNIQGTMDFGNMVYLLIEHGFFRKDEKDSLEDFYNVFDFDQALQVREHFEVVE